MDSGLHTEMAHFIQTNQPKGSSILIFELLKPVSPVLIAPY